ncbi:LDCC motif putative metal-binding protein [Sporosalibacterium faouarense]|nr:LDCC motif putative metal-binding protein [Sporosalibacterium faouarense]
MKKWFQKLIKKIEEANKKEFGSGPMDCCDLNKKDNPGSKKSN